MADPAHPHLSVTGVAGLRGYGRGATTAATGVAGRRCHEQLAPAILGGYGRGGLAVPRAPGGQGVTERLLFMMANLIVLWVVCVK